MGRALDHLEKPQDAADSFNQKQTKYHVIASRINLHKTQLLNLNIVDTRFIFLQRSAQKTQETK